MNIDPPGYSTRKITQRVPFTEATHELDGMADRHVYKLGAGHGVSELQGGGTAERGRHGQFLARVNGQPTISGYSIVVRKEGILARSTVILQIRELIIRPLYY